jgi:hypothetical protein
MRSGRIGALALAIVATGLSSVHIAARASANDLSSAEVVFKHQTQACDTWDVPDMAAKAFRDDAGKIHLIASYNSNRALVGSSFDDLKKACAPIYKARQSSDPAAFDDLGWLESFYTIDGRTVFALVSMDYHPDRHNSSCATVGGCWFSAITWAVSHDGGRQFTSPDAPERFVAGPLERFDRGHASTVGALVPTNIVRSDNYFYAMASFAANGLQKGGECVLRTSDLANPQAWRAWDGDGYNVAFLSPYANDGSGSQARKPCTPVGGGSVEAPLRTLVKTSTGKFLTVFLRANEAEGTPQGAYASYSDDLIHWSKARLLLAFEVFRPEKCIRGEAPTYWYPSLIDPSDKSRNFEVVGDSAYLYLTRLNQCGYADRDLVRVKVAIPRPQEP